MLLKHATKPQSLEESDAISSLADGAHACDLEVTSIDINPAAIGTVSTAPSWLIDRMRVEAAAHAMFVAVVCTCARVVLIRGCLRITLFE